jgi:hypothetical protein
VGGLNLSANALQRGAASQIGTEMDAVVRWQAHARVAVEAGYAYFVAGEYIADTAPASEAADDAQFAYLQVLVQFKHPGSVGLDSGDPGQAAVVQPVAGTGGLLLR